VFGGPTGQPAAILTAVPGVKVCAPKRQNGQIWNHVSREKLRPNSEWWSILALCQSAELVNQRRVGCKGGVCEQHARISANSRAPACARPSDLPVVRADVRSW